MKTISNILLVILFMLSPGFSQDGSPSVKVRIEATVEDYIEMITIADIDVGTVIPSEDYLRLDPRNDQGAGLIKIHGRQNASVQISYTSQIEMTNFATEIPLSVVYTVSGNTENNQSASEFYTSNPVTVSLGTTGEYYIWIGCEFSMLNLVAGQYDGDFVIEVDYN